MAAARKNFSRTTGAHLPPTEDYEYACFMRDLLDGKIEATDVQEQRDGRQRLVRLTHNDPTG